jgi:hypothetical protein
VSDQPDSITTADLITLFSVIAVIIGAVVGAGGALIGTVISERAAAKRHRERIAREDRLHKERLEREDRHRFTAEKKELYARFASSNVFLAYAANKEAVNEYLIHSMSSMAAIKLIGDQAVISAASSIMNFTRKFVGPGVVPEKEDADEMTRLLQSFDAAAREELAR